MRGVEVKSRWPHQYMSFLEQQCLGLIEEKVTAVTQAQGGGGGKRGPGKEGEEGKGEEEEEVL